VRLPSSVSSSSERAAADIHRLELRKCRRATRPHEIIESMLQLSRNDTQFMKPLLTKIDLPANLELSQQLLAQKEALQQRFLQFLERTGAA
jgi:predicted transcriptional regulator